MSLVLSLKYEGGVLIACDSKASPNSVDPKQPVRKMMPLSRFCVAGFAGVAQVADCVISQMAGTTDRYIDEALLHSLTDRLQCEYGRFMRTVSDPRDKHIPVSVLVAGYSNADQIRPVIYLLSSKSGFYGEPVHSNCVIGIIDTARYLLLRHFRSAMPFQVAAGLALLTLAGTSEIEPELVGPPFHISTITATEGYSEVPQDELSRFQESANAYNAKVASAFTETFH